VDGGKVRLRADRIAADLPPDSWRRTSAGPGSKGPRWYDWAWLDLTHTGGQPGHTLLIRRNATTGELAFYRCWSPRPVPLSTLVRVAGVRWMVEMRHPWCTPCRGGVSSRVVSFLPGGWLRPAGAGVVAGRPVTALA
jgi:hypothetical protein